MQREKIPNPVIAEVSDALGSYYSHTKLDTLFQRSGAPGDPPPGNRVNKCSEWLRRANDDDSINPFAVLGGVLEEFLEREPGEYEPNYLQEKRERVKRSLEKYGLSYQQKGRILGVAAATPTRTLEMMIRDRDLPGIDSEFKRALDSVNSDPAASVTAACAILESLFKIHIQDNDLSMPSDQTIKPLWKVVQCHLGLQPGSVADQDMTRILGGLSSIVDGVGALRTHAGSAHGKGRGAYTVTSKHARLANHSAHTVANFVIETWDERIGSSPSS